MGNDDNEFRRGYTHALDTIDEALESVQWWFQDDNGTMGETTRAVLAAVGIKLQNERHAFEGSCEADDRVERIQAKGKG